VTFETFFLEFGLTRPSKNVGLVRISKFDVKMDFSLVGLMIRRTYDGEPTGEMTRTIGRDCEGELWQSAVTVRLLITSNYHHPGQRARLDTGARFLPFVLSLYCILPVKSYHPPLSY